MYDEINNFMHYENYKMSFRSGAVTASSLWVHELLDAGVDYDTVLRINDKAQDLRCNEEFDKQQKVA